MCGYKATSYASPFPGEIHVSLIYPESSVTLGLTKQVRAENSVIHIQVQVRKIEQTVPCEVAIHTQLLLQLALLLGSQGQICWSGVSKALVEPLFGAVDGVVYDVACHP